MKILLAFIQDIPPCQSQYVTLHDDLMSSVCQVIGHYVLSVSNENLKVIFYEDYFITYIKITVFYHSITSVCLYNITTDLS